MKWFYNLNKNVRILFSIIPAVAANICFCVEQIIPGAILLAIAIIFLIFAYLAQKKDKEKAASEEQAKKEQSIKPQVITIESERKFKPVNYFYKCWQQRNYAVSSNPTQK